MFSDSMTTGEITARMRYEPTEATECGTAVSRRRSNRPVRRSALRPGHRGLRVAQPDAEAVVVAAAGILSRFAAR